MYINIKEEILAMLLDWEGTCSEQGGSKVALPTEKIGMLAHLLYITRIETGAVYVLNSGRPAPYMELANQSLGLGAKYGIICENGAIILYLPSGKYKVNPIITEEKQEKFQKIKPEIYKYARKIGASRELGKEFSASFNPPEGMPIKKLYQLITEEFHKYKNIIEITHSQSAVDVTIKGVNKETGLEFWLRETGVDIKKTSGVGDSKGDWPFLKKVAKPACPCNATSETQNLVYSLKKGYVSCYPSTQGTIDCIGHIIDNDQVKRLAKYYVEKISMGIPVEHFSYKDLTP